MMMVREVTCTHSLTPACALFFLCATSHIALAGTWQVSGPRNNPDAKLAVDRNRQVLLGLRDKNDRSMSTLQELEAKANYTGPSGAIKIS
jgi:hypothetical protein